MESPAILGGLAGSPRGQVRIFFFVYQRASVRVLLARWSGSFSFSMPGVGRPKHLLCRGRFSQAPPSCYAIAAVAFL